MPYGPHTDDDRARMLATIGVSSIDELFADIPAELRASPLDLPEPESELPLSERLQALASRNRVDLASFLGAGAYRHFSPPVVDQMLLRGEWYTAYTPYQPEVSQGTLQSIYEYQSLLAELTGLDVVSASHYDGGAATAEAALMACRATRRERVLVSPAVHPHYRADPRHVLRGRRTPGRRAAAGRGWRRRRHHRSRGARAASRGCRPAGGRGRRRPAELLRAAGAHGGHRARRPRRRRAARERDRAGVPRGPGAARGVRRGYRGRRGPAAGHPAPVRRAEPRHPRVHRCARAPDPRPARGHDARPRREAGVRDDASRARAGHPARACGQQHLHEPGPARACRVRVARDARAAWAARRGRARCRARHGAGGGARRRRHAPRPPGPLPQRVRRPGARRARRPRTAARPRGPRRASAPRPLPGPSRARRRAAGVRDGGHDERRDRRGSRAPCPTSWRDRRPTRPRPSGAA